MTLKNFLKVWQEGSGMDCISIYQMPEVDYRYEKKYFEEARREDIEESETFEKIKSKQIDHFCILDGSRSYPVEVCIFLKEER